MRYFTRKLEFVPNILSMAVVTSGLLKITLFLNKGYDFIMAITLRRYEIHNAISKILSRDSNRIVDMVIWRKFGDSSISMREVSGEL